MNIVSTAFENNQSIPEKYSCDGDGVNPPLSITGIPEEAKSLALVVDDPDAPGDTFVHWVVYNMPITGTIGENSTPGTQGVNSAGKTTWMGPCPPSGSHRYYFKCYALDAELPLGDGVGKEELETAMKGHILDNAELIGIYSR